VTRTVAHFGALHAAVANAGFIPADHPHTIADGDPDLWAPMVLVHPRLPDQHRRRSQAGSRHD
jgi:hypothetical protein